MSQVLFRKQVPIIQKKVDVSITSILYSIVAKYMEIYKKNDVISLKQT